MTVSKFTQPDCTTQQPAAYKNNIDSAIAAMKQMGAGFAPRAEDTPSMKIAVDPGAVFNRATGGFATQTAQLTATITAPGANSSKIVRVYVDETGAVGKVEGAAAASPVAPNYPAGVWPVCQVTIASTTTSITNSMITDERAFNTGYGTPRNTFLITVSGTFHTPGGAKVLRLTAAGGGGGGGPGASAASDATKYGGGGGGGAASVIGRLFNPEDLTITIGAGGTGGTSATAAGVTTGQVAATAGGTTSVTGVTSGLTFSCAGGALGGAAGVAANGTGGAGGTAGTGVAGTAGANGVANTNGGNGGGVGTTASLSAGGKGAVLATTRTGSAGVRGAGGGAAIGYSPTSTDKGGNGGDGFVLVEVF